MINYIKGVLEKFNLYLFEIFNESETKLYLFFKFIEVIGFIIIILSVKSFIINRKVDINEEYDEAGNF